MKVTVYFDESTEEVELTYSGKWWQLYGLTGWFREHQAVIGDKVVIQPLGENKYRLKFVKVKRERAPVARALFEDLPNLVVGAPINFRGIVYAPLNEAGVILLFSKVMEDLGVVYEVSPSRFPDAVVRRATSKGYELKFVEFEHKSSNFLQHEHDVSKCDIIVCWEHDWEECPLEVIELKQLIKKLPAEISK